MTSTLRRGSHRPADRDEVAVASLSAPTRRRPSWLAGGVLLVALAALLGVWLFSSATSTISVMVAADDLPPGHVVTRADLRVVEMGQAGGLRAIQVHQQDLVVGSAARSLIPEGTVVHTGLFTTPQAAVPPGKVVVGGAFAAGAVPVPSLRPGDRVVLLSTTPAPLGAATEVTHTAIELGAAEVWAVEGAASAGSSSTKVWVSLLVDVAIQGQVAQAAASDQLRLGLVAP
ncbi:MAG TPA: SAF domain-containing protein [Ilumatobacter sp.]|nr:SAF domain-containing protein [Ilumatobacter sp.]